jgi:tRNA(adenine34) deaminase
VLKKGDEFFMREALRLAQRASDEGEIPVGAVVVAANRIIGKGYNETEKLNDSTAHAEMIALTSAFQNMGAKYLPECVLYVTLEPCPMCAGALHWAQIEKIVFGAADHGKGYSMYKSPDGKNLLHPSTSVISGVLQKECKSLIEEFFKRLRGK